MRTTADGERAARSLLRSDWDANGTASIHLPFDVAVDLLDRRGWVIDHSAGCWVSPNGERYWEPAEALQVALVAEVAPPAAEVEAIHPTRWHALEATAEALVEELVQEREPGSVTEAEYQAAKSEIRSALEAGVDPGTIADAIATAPELPVGEAIEVQREVERMQDLGL